ncbi:MAG: Ppx/GppA family phosphatase [Nitrospirae bacterium]|nr:MAG: Ppx/GppA family phosphatase [Nitrospirota bacterium]
MSVYAGIDIGTLTLRLLIARIGADGRLHELASERRIVRLGEGLEPSRRLQPAPMARALETIAEWTPVIERAGAREVVAVATSAVRDAVNRDEFLGAVKRRSGLDVEVISGEEEARLSLLGIQSGLSAGVDRFVALDIGGGSTEFITVAPGQAPAMVSVDEGVVRLTEECLRSDPVRPDELASARARIARHLDVVEAKLGSLAGYRLVGTAGTITTLAAMDQRLAVYAPPRIHNYRLSVKAVQRILADLIARTRAQRRELVGLEPGREDLIVAGTLILAECLDQFGFSECLVSDTGLREGVLIDRWQKSR